ncbi:MAG TPA: hypothetical protein VEQ15_04965 [Myxococcales bacterium]|nr:hypothetical protein [Myxococcales bacterium]
MPPRKRLGQLLTELKVIDEHQLQSALGHQKQWGGKLGVILVQKEFCREEQMISALSQHLGMPAVRLSEVKIDPRAVKTVSKSVAERLHVFAYEVTGSGRSEVITIAMSDPTDLSAVDQLAFHTGKRIKPMLAGDSEVIAAIQQHYPAEKPAEEAQLPAGSRPFVEGARQGPGASGRLTPVSPLAPVPPAATPTPSFSRRVEPPRPPPPVMPAAPHAHAAPAPTGGNGALAAVEEVGLGGEDLPADAPMEGLEPIAAHTQGGESVEGAEELAGQGTPADAVADLEAVNPHETVGAVEVQGIDGLEPGVPPQEAEGAAPDAAAAEAPPLDDPAALQGWAEGQNEGIALEIENPAAAYAPAEGGWSETAELPVDAIMGTADVLETAPEDPAPASDAPDAWNDIADPLAAPAGEAATPESAWAAAAAEVAAAAEELDPAGQGESLLDPPGDSPAPAEEIAIEAEGWSEEPASGIDEGQADAASGQEAAFVMEEDAAREGEHPITEPQGWISPAEDAGAEADQIELGSEEEPELYSATGDAAQEQAPGEEGYGEGAPAEQQYAEEAPGTEEAAYAEAAGQEEYGQQENAEGEQPAEEGWVATPEDQQQQAGWLSAADLGTLAALGLDPSDASGAQRMLACLVRVLDRRQAIDLDELATEIRESRLAGEAAAQAQAQDQAGVEPGAGEPAEEAAQTPGTGQDPWTGSHDS